VASTTYTGAGWIPVGTDPNVIQKINQMSAIEAYGRPNTMTTRTKLIPRSGGVVMDRVAKGGTFADDGSPNDSVLLTADKIGGMVRVDEEDIEDSLANIIDTKTIDAATTYSKLYDNSCIGATAAKGTTGWLYDSLYYTLTQADATTSYTASSNITQSATSGGVTYANLSAALGKVEQGDWFDPANLVVICHPSFAQVLREIVDSQGRPIFNESRNGTAGGGQGGAPLLFDYPLHWSLGSRTTAVPTSNPTGNPLLVFAQRQLLHRGDLSPLEVSFQSSEEGLGFATDQNLLRFRARKSVAFGAPGGFSIVEKRS
jgi:HK97 family phage major capsid protein